MLRPRDRSLLLTLFAAALIRGIALCSSPTAFREDADGYRRLAENLRESGIYGWRDENSRGGQPRPTAFRPPLYPLLLVPLVEQGTRTLILIGSLHWMLGVATVGLTWWLAANWHARRWAWLAGLLVACDPILLHQSTQLMTETTATFLAVLGLVGLTTLERTRRTLVVGLTGAALATAVLCRPSFLPWMLLSVAAMVLLHPFRGRRLRTVLAFVAGAAIVLAPWAVRNQLRFGHWKVTTTHGGYTLLLANNPSFYRSLREGRSESVWTSEALAQAWAYRAEYPDPGDPAWATLQLDPDGLIPNRLPARWSEFDDDRLAYELARRYIRAETDMFLLSCIVRWARLWRLTPHRLDVRESDGQRSIRWAIGVWYGSLFVLAIGGAIGLRGGFFRTPWIWGLLLCFAFMAVHSLFWTDMRMRAPITPFVCLLSAVGVERTAAWVVRRNMLEINIL